MFCRKTLSYLCLINRRVDMESLGGGVSNYLSVNTENQTLLVEMK